MQYKMIIIAVTSVVVLVSIWTLSVYESLPDIIPTHFGPDGKADDFGSKSAIWILPGLMAAMIPIFAYGLLVRDEKFRINWPVKEENRPHVIIFLRRYLAMIFCITMCMLAFLHVSSVLVAQEKIQKINSFLMFAQVGLLLIIAFGGIFRMQSINAGRTK